MHFQTTQTPGTRIHHHISRIRCEASRALSFTGDAYPDHLIDLLAFLLTIYIALRSNMHEFQRPGLFGNIARDSTHYFLVIFTSHLVLELTLLLGRVRISSRFPVSSLRLTETFVACNTTAPRQVSDAKTIPLSHLFTGSFPASQWKRRVCLNFSFLPKPSDPNHLLGTFR